MRYIIRDLDGNKIDASDDKDEAVMLSVMHDGTWEDSQDV